MTGKLLRFGGATRNKGDAGAELNDAMDCELDTVVIVGWKPNGEFYFASNEPDAADALFLLEAGKTKLMDEALK